MFYYQFISNFFESLFVVFTLRLKVQLGKFKYVMSIESSREKKVDP